MDKYLVEFMFYEYHWIDKGVFFSNYVRGSVSGVDSTNRSYHVYNDLEKVKEVMEERMKHCDDGLFVVSKLIGKTYVPGKLRIGTFGEPSWTRLDDFKWVRQDCAKPRFFLMPISGGACWCQKLFYEKGKTFSELCESIMKRHGPAIIESMDRYFEEKSLFGRIRKQ